MFCIKYLQISMYQVWNRFWESKIVLGHDASNCCFENLKESEISVYKKVKQMFIVIINFKN